MTAASTAMVARQVGARIVQMRKSKGLTQAQLSDCLPENVVPGYVSRWERGENLPSWENLRALAQVFDVSEGWLLYGDDNDRIDVSLVPDVPGMPGRELGIAIESGVNQQAKPFCHVVIDGKTRAQMTPNEVRSMAMQWLEAAEAAEHDAALMLFLLAATPERQAFTVEMAATLIGELRQHRGDNHTSTRRPS